MNIVYIKDYSLLHKKGEIIHDVELSEDESGYFDSIGRFYSKDNWQVEPYDAPSEELDAVKPPPVILMQAVPMAPPMPKKPRKHAHYFKRCPYDEVDVYRVIDMFGLTDGCLQHALKKILVAGGRGAGKDISQDVQEAIDTLTRWQEMRSEDNARHI